MTPFPEFEPRTVDTALGRVSYTHNGSGPGLVFLHGLAGNSASFALQLAAFDAYRTIAWDAPGYGDTSPCEETDEATVEHYADRVIALLDALDIERAAVVGHSMGGVVAGALATRHPHRVSALLLSCTHTGNAAPADAPLTAGHRRRLEDLETLGPVSYGRARARDMLAPGASEPLVDRIADIAGRTTRAGLESAIRAIHGADTRATIGRVDIPVTVVAGAVDPIAPREKTDALAALLPHCHYEVIDRSAHAPYMEQPETFNRILAGLLETR